MASSSFKYRALPYINVQPDFPAVINDVSQSIVRSESFWVSAYCEGRPSVHGRDPDGDLVLRGRDGVTLESKDENILRVAFPSLEIPATLLRRPRQVITSAKEPAIPKRVNSLDISSTRPLLAVGGDDGALVVLDLSASDSTTTTSSPPLKLKGCKGDICDTRFFPSGEVLLSSTLSSMIHVHSAVAAAGPLSTEPARTLTAHTRPVTASSILDRGRHVLSASKDGVLRQWRVADATTVASVKFGDEVWSLALEQTQQQDSARAWVGLKSGGVWSVRVGGEETPTLEIVGERIGEGEEPIGALAWSPSGYLATGSANGFLSLYSFSSIDEPPILIARLRRSEATINSLAWLEPTTSEKGGSRLVVGGADGMPWVCGKTSEDETSWGVVEELAGWEKSIECVRVGGIKGNEIWVGGKDGVGRY